MLFDIRQNLLMVRIMLEGQPVYHFYNAIGRELQITGPQFKEIVERQFEAELRVDTHWGSISKATPQLFKFDEQGDMVMYVAVSPAAYAWIPYAMLSNGDDNIFPVISGFKIEDRVRLAIRAHLNAVGTPPPTMIWANDLPETELRIILKSFGMGPVRVDRSDKEGLMELWEEFMRKHDETYKYTHRACGLEDDEMLPADLYDMIKPLSRRQMASTKTEEMMLAELNSALRVFDLHITASITDDTTWSKKEAYACLYNKLYSPDNNDSLLRDLNRSPQFRSMIIYGLAADLTHQTICGYTENYAESLTRRLIQELAAEIDLPDSGIELVEGMALVIERNASIAFLPCAIDDMNMDALRYVLRGPKYRQYNVKKLPTMDLLELFATLVDEEENFLNHKKHSELAAILKALTGKEAHDNETSFLIKTINDVMVFIDLEDDE